MTTAQTLRVAVPSQRQAALLAGALLSLAAIVGYEKGWIEDPVLIGGV